MEVKLIDEIYENINSIEIILRITRICNQKCIFCFTHNDQITTFSINDVIRELTEVLKNTKWKTVEFVITWWEPTINPDFFKIIDYLYKKWKIIRLQTNAVFFWNKKNYEKIKPYLRKLDLFISFHSHNEKIYNYITQTKWLYKLAIKWIINLLKANRLELNIVINKLNINYFIHYVDFIGKTFLSKKRLILNISMLTNLTKWKQVEKLSVSYTDVINIINKSETLIKRYNITIARAFWAPSDLPFCIWKKVFYFEKIIYTKARKTTDRIKLSFCDKCVYNDYCNGILKIYVEKYWMDEFNPIID